MRKGQLIEAIRGAQGGQATGQVRRRRAAGAASRRDRSARDSRCHRAPAAGDIQPRDRANEPAPTPRRAPPRRARRRPSRPLDQSDRERSPGRGRPGTATASADGARHPFATTGATVPPTRIAASDRRPAQPEPAIRAQNRDQNQGQNRDNQNRDSQQNRDGQQNRDTAEPRQPAEPGQPETATDQNRDNQQNRDQNQNRDNQNRDDQSREPATGTTTVAAVAVVGAATATGRIAAPAAAAAAAAAAWIASRPSPTVSEDDVLVPARGHPRRAGQLRLRPDQRLPARARTTRTSRCRW